MKSAAIRRILETVTRRPGAVAVFLVGCALFLALRVVVVSGAVDHLHGVDDAEYQIAEMARQMIAGQPAEVKWSHLWSQPITAKALVGLLRAGLTDTEASKALAIAVAFLGYAALLFLLLARSGTETGAAFALLGALPSLPHLKWTLVLWGSYPEAGSLMLAAVVLAIFAAEKGTTPRLAVAGVACGLALSYSFSVIFVAAAILVLMPRLVGDERTWRKTAIFAGGLAAGLLPLLVWAAGHGFGLTYAPEVIQYTGLTNAPVFGSIGFPDTERLVVAARKVVERAFSSEPVLRFAAIGWVLAAGLWWRRRFGRWRLVFPAAALLAFVFAAFFPYASILETRHLVVVFSLANVCIALMIGDRFVDLIPRLAGSRLWHGVERAAKWIVVAAVLALHIVQIAPLVQPDDLGLIARYRGLTYYHLRMGSMIGPEVDRINAMLDAGAAPLDDFSFTSGLEQVFPMSGYYDTLPGPLPFRLASWDRPDHAPDARRYFEGIGCACALKTLCNATRLTPPADSDAAAHRDALLAGYGLCEGAIPVGLE